MKINYKKNTKKLLAYLMVLAIVFLFTSNSIAQNATVSTIGNGFSPPVLSITVGDDVDFDLLGTSHNAVEVSQGDWSANLNNPLLGGFSTGVPGTNATIPNFASVQTYYYICQPHISGGMKGRIIASAVSAPFTYSGSMVLCGNPTTTITAYINGCSFPFPALGTEYTLTDNIGTILVLDRLNP